MPKWVSEERQKRASVRINLPSGIMTNNAVKITAPDDFNSLETIALAPLYSSDAQRTQSSLNKGADSRGDDHPKIAGHHECFEGLRKQESDAIFLKSTNALPFRAKKKMEIFFSKTWGLSLWK